MKKFLVIILISIICIIPVQAEESIKIESIKVIKSSDGVILNDKNQVNAIFNDLNQQVKYEAVIKNNSDKNMYVNFLEVENSSEEFIEYKLDTKSENMVLEPNSSSKVTFYVNTLAIEGAGRNLDDEVQINFMVSDEIYNPNTNTNMLDVIIMVIVLLTIIYFVRKNKKVQTLTLIIGLTTIGIISVDAVDYIKVTELGNVKYESQNKIIATGTLLNGEQADYTNAKEVWAYYDKVKNVEVKSLMNEPKDYYKKFDLTENKAGRVMAYLTENNDKDTPYDLTIMSQGVIIANKDSSFMFSFPKTEKVEGLKNVDFSETTSMQGMFIGNEKLEKVEADAIELNNTIDTSYMFYNCEEIEHGRSDFDLENVTNTTMMFTPYLYNEVKDGATSDINVDFSKPASSDNGEGKMLLNTSSQNENSIYYYRGNVEDNNVLFAGYCWKIVRTTETRGVKLIYNGMPDSNGYCNATGDQTLIGKEKYNPQFTSPYDGGYMYGERYEIGYTAEYEEKRLIQAYKTDGNSNYLYSDKVIYKDGKYILQNPQNKIWKDNYDSLKHYYTCRSENDTCEKVEYLVIVTSTYQYSLRLSNGETPDDMYIYVAKKIKKNSNNTFSLVDEEKVSYENWYEENQKKEYISKRYKSYYHCENYKETTCENMYSIGSTTPLILYDQQITHFVYGNDIKYENGKYKLIDTYTTTLGWPMAREDVLGKHHYTCLSDKTECEIVYYTYQFLDDHSMYIILSNGDNIESAKKKMHQNKYDAPIKTYIDNWYANNITSYSGQLEDTVYCVDREFTEGTLKNKDSGSLKYYHPFFAAKVRFDEIYTPTLNCSNKLDQFTVEKENGNGALTYPIALLTADEAVYSGMTATKDENNYLNNGTYYWTITPYHFSMDHGTNFVISNYGQLSRSDILSIVGVRPTISLKSKIKYTTGNGTKENPYIIEGIEQ